MQKSAQIFLGVASRVTSGDYFNEILQKQNNTFDKQVINFQSCSGEIMFKIYTEIVTGLNLSQKADSDLNHWNQNQRKVFVWFMVCYTYFQQIDNNKKTQITYDQLSPVFFGKKPEFLHFQHLNILKQKSRVVWTKKEDQLLIKYTNQSSLGKWNQVAKKIFYYTNRKCFKTPKQCRERWLNHLDKNKKHGKWTPQEDLVILEYTVSKGKKWSKIVPVLGQTRTEHMIKNRYNSLISKFRKGKKEKEEQIVKRILNLLIQINNSSLNERQIERQPIHSDIKQQQVSQYSNQQNNHSLNLIPTLPASFSHNFNIPIAMQMGYFSDYNPFFFPQIYFNQNRTGYYQLEHRQTPQIECQRNSSNSTIQPQAHLQQHH